MNIQELISFCMKNGLLLDSEVLNLFSEISDGETVKLLIEKIKNNTHERLITKNVFSNSKELENIFLMLPKENQKTVETLKIKLGLSIEISREERRQEIVPSFSEDDGKVKVLSSIPVLNSKLEVQSFVRYFRNRLFEMKNILQGNPRLSNLVSINKIPRNRQSFSIIGIVSDKRTTKNNNIIFEMEDLSGKIKVLVNNNKEDLYKEAEDVTLDSVIGIKGTGDSNILFANDIVFPDSIIHERKKSPVDERALFIGDLHYGSKLFFENSFLKFIDYINGKIPNPDYDKIKYLFIAGDAVTGVGNYPTQERDLKISTLEEQFSGLAELLGRIRKDVKIILSTGNHDGVRLMEPQPAVDPKYAWALYDMKNVILTGNPAFVNIGERKGFSGMDVLTYHGFSFPFYADNIPKLMKEKAMNTPEKIMAYLLKNRHLAPTHTSVQYFPFDEDNLVIKKIPDILLSAHTHKSAVAYYNNILTISVATWEAMTAYQEKMGNQPDFCKVPMFNMKTREVKILDFEEKE